jgi:hypothetical protein
MRKTFSRVASREGDRLLALHEGGRVGSQGEATEEEDGVTRDMTKRQFLNALAERGFRLQGFLGYVDLGNGLHVSRLNAGNRLRDQLAYLIRSYERHEAEKAKVTA